MRRPSVSPARALAALAASLLLAACGGGSDASTGFVAGDGSITLVDEAQRVPAPDVSGIDLDGGAFRLADYRGKVVVLNVWASWCAPCRAEAPDLERAWRDLQSQGVQFVGLNTRDSQAAATAFVDRFGLTFPSVTDQDGRLQLLFADSLPPQAIPSTVVIDQQGRVAGRILGRASEAALRGMVESLLPDPALPDPALPDPAQSDPALPDPAR